MQHPVGTAGASRTVVYLDHCAKMSGAELALLRTVAQLRRYTPVVVLGEDGPLHAALTAQGTRTVVLPLPGTARDFDRRAVGTSWSAARRGAEVAGYARRLRRVVAAEDPVLVHSNSMKAHVYGALAVAGTGVPQLAHVRDRVSTDFMSAGGVRLMHRVLRRPRALVANSRSTERSVPRRRADQHRLVLPSPIDVPAAPVVPRDPGGAVTFGVVGRLTRWKGQHLALDAFAEVCRRDPATHRLLVVGGDLFGEAEYAAGLRRQAAALGVADRVEFLGHVADVYGAMARMQVLVHSSVIPEPFGQVVVQGMAMGLPVVAAGEGGPAEVLTDGVDGLLYPPGDAGALARRMLRLAASPGLRADLGAAARAESARYAAPVVTDRLESFYDTVLRAHLPAHLPRPEPVG